MNKPSRLSNLELLRILSMFGVLIVHSDFGALDTPTLQELQTEPLFCLSRILIEAFAVVSVNVFVLLSGWFGIKFKVKGLCYLLFQCAFFLFGIYGLCVVLGIESLGVDGIKKCLMLSDNVWFVKCYLGMYIFAPVLNMFVEKADRSVVKTVIIAFLVFQTIFGWLSNGAAFILSGYSAFSFMGLYLLARYVRTYQPSWSQRSAGKDALTYITLTLTTAVCMLLFIRLDKFTYFVTFMDYVSPLVIFGGVFLLLTFSKLQFQSKVVNWVATSCFAVYLQHFILFPQFMTPWIQHIAGHNNGIMILAKTSGLLFAFFSIAILVDKIRLFIWNHFIASRFN